MCSTARYYEARQRRFYINQWKRHRAVRHYHCQHLAHGLSGARFSNFPRITRLGREKDFAVYVLPFGAFKSDGDFYRAV